MKVSGPLVTLGAVAALGIGILLVNVSREPEPTTPGKPVAESVTTTNPSTTDQVPTPSTPPPAPFPAKADYVGEIPTSNGVITLEITVHGNKAVAYACDGNTVEVWLAGSAENGIVNLASKDNTSRLEGNTVVGTLWIGKQKWGFTTAAVQPPAGLYVYTEGGARSSWIIDANGAVTGVQRQPNGSTSPAPPLYADGTAVINGRTVTATRVEGDSNDF
jgi:hypothetical protein